MRRKNGYTLTEILVVILLLAVVGGIIIFNVNSILNKNKQKSYERYLANVKSSAETYASLNLDKVNDLYENKSFTYITAGELIDNGFLDEKTTNPYTNQRIGRDELIKLSLSTETGDLTITYPATEENKEVFLSAVVLSTTVDKEVNCMEGIGTYQLALSDETGKLILDKNTLINDYNFTCKLPSGFNKRTEDMNNEVGSTSQIGTYEIEYYWVSKSGTKGTGKRFLKVVPDTVTITYDVSVVEGNDVDAWTNATCVGKIIGDQCKKEVLVGYNYSTLSRPTRRGYNFVGWYRNKQLDPENPTEGTPVEPNNKVVENSDHTLYAHWDRMKFRIKLNSDLNERPAVNPGTTYVEVKYNLIPPHIDPPERYYTVSFNNNDVHNSNGTTEATASESSLVAKWDFDGYNTSTGKPYYDSKGDGLRPWEELDVTELFARWSNGLITLPSASRPGYTFQGWYTSNGIKRENDFRYEETTELIAHWDPITYIVTLDFNDSEGSTRVNETVKQIPQVFDDNFDNLYEPTRNGYEFDGWYTDQGVKITKDTRATNDYLIINNNGLKLTAKWKKKEYKVELDLNVQPDMSYPIMMNKPLEFNTYFDTSTNNSDIGSPTLKGWNFLGWYTKENIKVYEPDGTYSKDTELFFDSQGNWIHQSGVKLYAKWEQKVYSLKVNLNPDEKMSFAPKLSNGVTDLETEYTMTFDSSENSTIPYGVLPGWKFLGYYDSNDDMVFDQTGKYVESTSNEYFNGSKWNLEDNLDVHAKWRQEPITVILSTIAPSADDVPTYDMSSYIFTYDEPVPDESIIIPSFLDGYEFLGWFDSDNTIVFKADGKLNPEATNYFNGTKWIMPDSVTLTPKWKANGYVITFNQPDATTKGTESINIIYNTSLPNITVPVRKYNVNYVLNDETGSQRSTPVENIVKQWTFDGYYTDSNLEYYNGSGQSSLTYRESRDITLNAKWSNGTLENMPNPTRVGYDFKGWYLDNKTFTNKVENGYTVTENITLYAKWEPHEYTITFKQNKASTEGDTSLRVVFDELIDDIRPPVKEYTVTLDKNYNVSNRTETKKAKWTFLGYYTQDGGSGTRYFDANGVSNLKYEIDRDLTLYANYEGGTITLPNYTRDDYIFTGWYDESNVQANNSDTYEEDKTLHIEWQSEEYNLVLQTGKPGNMSSVPKVANSSYKMYMHTPDNNVINVPTDYKGWNFLGWYSGDTQVFDSTGHWNSSASSFFDSEGNWIKREHTTLVGKWSQESYYIMLEPGSVNTSISPNTIPVKYDDVGPETVSIPDHVVGYAFDGYYLGSEMIYDASGNRVDGNSVFNASGIFRTDAIVRITAHYVNYPNMLELRIAKPEEMPETPNLAINLYEMSKGSAANNTVNIPASITGFNFLGWYSGDTQVFDSTGTYVTSEYFDSTGKWLKDDGAILTSKYEPYHSTISLREQLPNGDTGSLNIYVADYAGTEPNTVEKLDDLEQYDFKGWYYGDTQVFDRNGNKNLSATQFFDRNGKWLYLDDVILVSKWESLDIKVTLDLDADSLPFEPQLNTIQYTMVLNSTNNNRVNVPTNVGSGYSFQGWYDGTTQVYKEDGTYNSSASNFFTSTGEWKYRSSITLKAKWIKL